MGFEPTTLHDIARCSDHRATGDSMVSKGQLLDLDWNHIVGLDSQVRRLAHVNSLTALHCHIYLVSESHM